MQNPFSKEQLKNYLLLYAAIVVIMLLFYVLNSLLNEQKRYEQKRFETNSSAEVGASREKPSETVEINKSESRFKLLEEGY